MRYLLIITLLTTPLSYGMDPYNRELGRLNELFEIMRVDVEKELSTKKLAYALCEPSVELAQEALQEGADSNKSLSDSHRSYSFLCYALAFCPDEMVKLLLDHGANPNCGTDSEDMPIMAANTPEQLSLLMKAGADIHTRNEEGETALINALTDGKPHLVPFFIEAGIDLNAQDAKGNTALHKAIENLKFSSCTSLIDAGADIYLRNDEGKYSWSMASPKHFECPTTHAQREPIRVLLEAADQQRKKLFPYMRYIDNLSCELLQAARQEDLTKPAELVEAGALLNFTYLGGPTPIGHAIEKGNVEFCEVLLKAGAEPDSKGRGIELYSAVPHEKLVSLLLNYGASADPLSNGGQTPLMKAIHGKHLACAQLLLNAGANVFRVDHSRWTALHYAAMQGDKDICALILNRLALIRKGIITGLLCLKKIGKENAILKEFYRQRAKLLAPYLKPFYDSHTRKKLLEMKTNNGETAYRVSLKNGRFIPLEELKP